MAPLCALRSQPSHPKKLHIAEVASGRSLPIHVLNGNHPAGIECAHHLGRLLSVVDLAAAADTDDQDVGATEKHFVLTAEGGGGAAEMGEVETCLLPAPHRGLAKTTATHPVMGSGEPFDPEATDR